MYLLYYIFSLRIGDLECRVKNRCSRDRKIRFKSWFQHEVSLLSRKWDHEIFQCGDSIIRINVRTSKLVESFYKS